MNASSLAWNVVALCALISACGSTAPPPPRPAPPPPAPARPPTPPAPEFHRVALSVIMPEPAPTRSALTADGRFVCRDVLTASPPENERHCLADGHGITARVLFVIGRDGEQRTHLDAPVEVRRIRDCGNDERWIRRPPRSLLGRLVPELATAPPSRTADLTGAAFVSCAAPDVIVEIPHDAELVHAGSLLRVRAPSGGRVRLIARDREAASWNLDTHACAAELALEVLCAADTIVVSGGPLGCDPGASITTTNLPCIPEVTPIGPAFASFERIVIDTTTGTSVPIAITPPRLDTAP